MDNPGRAAGRRAQLVYVATGSSSMRRRTWKSASSKVARDKEEEEENGEGRKGGGEGKSDMERRVRGADCLLFI